MSSFVIFKWFLLLFLITYHVLALPVNRDKLSSLRRSAESKSKTSTKPQESDSSSSADDGSKSDPLTEEEGDSVSNSDPEVKKKAKKDEDSSPEDSNSNPDTEEEGDSKSASDEDDEDKKSPKADDSSQEKGSESNPDTEEEGPSESKSDEDDKKVKKGKKAPKHDDSSQEKDSGSDPNTEEEGPSESESDEDDKKGIKDDNSSEDEDNANSSSNPETEEEGDSNSESDGDEPKEGDSSDEDSNSNPDTEEEGDSDSASDSTSDEAGVVPPKDCERNKLLIILIDGLRYDYVSRDLKKLNGFKDIIEHGVKAPYVKPVFPASSYPNYYSIVTGLYPEKHGMISNDMYHPKREDVFMYGGPHYSDKHWWNKAKPLWTRAAEENLKVGVYWWPGCEISLTKNVKCTPYKDFTSSKDRGEQEFTDQLKKVVGYFHKNSLDLAMIYYENVDATGHKHGPESKNTYKAVQKVSNAIEELFTTIEEKSMHDKINVIVVGDHGMVTANKDINLSDYIDFNDVDVLVGGGAFAMIQPEDNKEDQIYEELIHANLKGLNVYKDENLPKRYHLKQSKLVLPIILTTDKGFRITTPVIKGKVFPEGGPSTSIGAHGYDPDHVSEMRTAMYGIGPELKRNFTSVALKQVDHYNLFCHLLKIKPDTNDGVWQRSESLLRSESDEDDSSDSESNSSDSSDDDSNESNSSEEKNKKDGGGASALAANGLVIICSVIAFILL